MTRAGVCRLPVGYPGLSTAGVISGQIRDDWIVGKIAEQKGGVFFCSQLGPKGRCLAGPKWWGQGLGRQCS